MRKSLSALCVALMLVSMLAPLAQLQALPPSFNVREVLGWKILETQDLFIALPLNGRIPVVLWWYKNQSDVVYVARYNGLLEYYLVAGNFSSTNASTLQVFMEHVVKPVIYDLVRKLTLHGYLYRFSTVLASLNQNFSQIIPDLEQNIDRAVNLTNAMCIVAYIMCNMSSRLDSEILVEHAQQIFVTTWVMRNKTLTFNETGDESLKNDLANLSSYLSQQLSTFRSIVEDRILQLRRDLVEIVLGLRETLRRLHAPFLPFAATTWECSALKPIVVDGQQVGVSFTLTLVDCWLPKFRTFVKGNIMLRNRIYSVPVNESFNGMSYTVYRSELKTDVIVEKWSWNVDLLNDFIRMLREKGYDVPYLNVSQAGLSLWVDVCNFEANTTELEERIRNAELISNLTATVNAMKLIAGEIAYAYEAVAKSRYLVENVTSAALDELSREDINWTKVAIQVELLQDVSVSRMYNFLNFLVAKSEQIYDSISVNVMPQYREQLDDIFNSTSDAINAFCADLSYLNETIGQVASAVAENNVEESTLLIEHFAEYYNTAATSLEESLRQNLESLGTLVRQLVATVRRMVVYARVRIYKASLSLFDELRDDVIMAVGAGYLRQVGVEFETGSAEVGFFRFVNACIIKKTDGTTVTRPVRLAYKAVGSHLHLFLLYPYFDGNSLEHDPSVGIRTPETAGEPVYVVNPFAASPVVPVAPIVLVTAVAALAVVAVRRRIFS